MAVTAMSRLVVVIATLAIGGVVGALMLRAPSYDASRAATDAIRPAWTEVQWPFSADPWGRGRAFRCATADCGAEINLYVRPKLGFCNCTTGIADDEDLDRMGDLYLIGDVSPLGAGRPISVAWMKGRSRAYA
ncbi:MAG TPA: hypothetical protein VHM01_06840, partial [Alphaproteobacteria bacterium]|nr:hypothetical protein [Alphaproteobacteria bacterium]